MAKQLIRLTEGDLHRIIKESVKNILAEVDWNKPENRRAAGMVAKRNHAKAEHLRTGNSIHGMNGGSAQEVRDYNKKIQNYEKRGDKAANFMQNKLGRNPYNDSEFRKGYSQQ